MTKPNGAANRTAKHGITQSAAKPWTAPQMGLGGPGRARTLPFNDEDVDRIVAGISSYSGETTRTPLPTAPAERELAKLLAKSAAQDGAAESESASPATVRGAAPLSSRLTGATVARQGAPTSARFGTPQITTTGGHDDARITVRAPARTAENGGAIPVLVAPRPPLLPAELRTAPTARPPARKRVSATRLRTKPAALHRPAAHLAPPPLPPRPSRPHTEEIIEITDADLLPVSEPGSGPQTRRERAPYVPSFASLPPLAQLPSLAPPSRAIVLYGVASNLDRNGPSSHRTSAIPVSLELEEPAGETMTGIAIATKNRRSAPQKGSRALLWLGAFGVAASLSLSVFLSARQGLLSLHTAPSSTGVAAAAAGAGTGEHHAEEAVSPPPARAVEMPGPRAQAAEPLGQAASRAAARRPEPAPARPPPARLAVVTPASAPASATARATAPAPALSPKSAVAKSNSLSGRLLGDDE